MSLCIKYVKDFEIKERFLGFIDCSEKQDAQALSVHILNYLQTCKLNESFHMPLLHTVWLTESLLLWICVKLLK